MCQMTTGSSTTPPLGHNQAIIVWHVADSSTALRFILIGEDAVEPSATQAPAVAQAASNQLTAPELDPLPHNDFKEGELADEKTNDSLEVKERRSRS